MAFDVTSGDFQYGVAVPQLQEVDRFNKLLSVVRGTLKALQAAIRGEV